MYFGLLLMGSSSLHNDYICVVFNTTLNPLMSEIINTYIVISVAPTTLRVQYKPLLYFMHSECFKFHTGIMAQDDSDLFVN